MTDARFEDGAERALNLRAETVDDLAVVATLVQDCVFPVTELKWDTGSRKLAFLINRFRWEDKSAAEAENRPYERVQSLLVLSDVTRVRSQGFDRGDKDLVLSILDLSWEAQEDTTGRLVVTLAGDGAIMAEAEALCLDLRDVTRPYRAVSGAAPKHAD
ncbi:DUF2948 family protein [Rhodobacteraceae bacterium]|nr:DUF2948 family protein [Paracoccaceae bacterium]